MIEDLHKSYGSAVIYEGFNLPSVAGRWAVGRNGAGKTTLLKMTLARANPMSGACGWAPA